MNLKQALRGKLSGEEIEKVHRAFEVIGDIAILDIPEELSGKKMLIAETLTRIHRSIKVVLNKTREVSGDHRVAEYEKLIGDRTETLCVENGCRLYVDPTKAYFSEKLGYERDRVANQVRDGELILCMFAGVGPFPINIAKKRDVKIWSIEINPEACKLFRRNIRANRYEKKHYVEERVKVICGDVADEMPMIKRKFDRILMPAPKNAEEYLDLALDKIVKGGIIHYYTFCGEEEFDNIKKSLKEKCESLGKKIQILEVRKCGHFAPRVWRVVADFKVKN